MNYVIIETKYLEYVNFSEVKEDNPDTLRYSLNGEKFFVKYEGDQPDFMFDITQDAVGLPEYSHQEILQILSSPEWQTQG
jgi:hypothetical protein|tara:strand:- start:1064 stop:1303 length:240 start_codon:yes stop_codon:yes gene_type:complete